MAKTEEKPHTPLELVKLAASYFEEKGVDSPRLDAEILLASVMGMERLGLYLNFDKPLSQEEISAYRELVRRRGQGEPAAYILGQREFWSLPFLTRPGVLIPRPDTELLVETALSFTDENLNVLELGVGSGAVIISILSERPTWKGTGVDISPEALATARENAGKHSMGERLSLLEGDLFSPLSGELYDLIVTNPPYIPTDEIGKLMPEVARFEPRLALDGGLDGLSVIRRICGEAHHHLRPGGALIMEFGVGQGEMVREALEISSRFVEIRLLDDLGGTTRAAFAKRAAS